MAERWPASVINHIERCWRQGSGIKQTRIAIKKIDGIDMLESEIQRQFADLSNRNHQQMKGQDHG